MTTILAFDTTLSACSAALLQDDAPRARIFEVIGRGHAERLMPMIEEVMAEAQCGYDALDAIAVTLGPGTFTGVRIGLAAARGLALAVQRPLIGVTTFEAVAVDLLLKAPELAGRTVTVIHDARRGEVYMQSFTTLPGAPFPRLVPRDAAAALPLDRAGNHIPRDAVVIGTGVALLEQALDPAAMVSQAVASGHPDALAVARIAAARMAEGLECISIRPIYLRPPDARLPSETPLS